MTTKSRPDKRIVLKSKAKNAEGKSRYQDLLGIWTQSERPYVAMDRRIVGLVLDTGETLQVSEFYANLDSNEARSTEPRGVAHNIFED